MATATVPPHLATQRPRSGILPRPRLDLIGMFQGMAAKQGDIATRRIGPVRLFLLSRPDLIDDVLIASSHSFKKGRSIQATSLIMGEGLTAKQGAEHRQRRRFLQPAYHKTRVEGYAAVMTEAAERHATRWHDGQVVDMNAEMMRLTLTIVGRTLFGADLEDEADEVAQALNDAMAAFEVMIVLPAPERVQHLPLRRMRTLRAARRRLDDTVLRLIRERRETGAVTEDLLTLLLDGEQDGAPLSDAQVRDEAMTALLTGHETTANGLTWTWYLLAQHPEVEQRMVAEVSEVLGDRPPTLEDIGRLTYTRQVFSEALRLYPPVWMMNRYAVRDHVVEGRRIPQGSLLFMSPYLLQHDPRWWPDPERFDPDRWAPGRQADLPRFAYFPFGGGVHRCIGEPFAWTEGVLVLASLARSWRLRLLPGVAPVELHPRVTLRPRHGLPMTVQRR